MRFHCAFRLLPNGDRSFFLLWNGRQLKFFIITIIVVVVVVSAVVVVVVVLLEK